MDHRSTPIAASALLCLLLCLPGSVCAEEPITPGFRQALTEFLISQNTVDVVQDQLTYSMSQYTLATMAAKGVEITEPMQDIVIDAARTSVGSRFGDVQILTDLYVPLYADLLTEDELRELARFWASPLGKKTMGLLPRLSEGSYAILQEASQPYVADFQAAVDKRFKEAGITPAP